MRDRDTEKVAKRLLGCYFIRKFGKKEIRVKIVETEAYSQEDEVSHTFRGMTRRNQTMFGEAGRLYVYLIYGIYHCCNVVAGRKGKGEGVLIRAVEGAAGPGKTTQFLKIDRSFNGHDLKRWPLKLEMGEKIPESGIVVTTRVGVREEKPKLRRFYIKGNEFVSRK